MRFYSYVARNSEGGIVKGGIEAAGRGDFFRKIDDIGLTCINYDEKTSQPELAVKTIARLNGKELILFCKKMGTMIAAGMSITGSLEVLINSSTNPKYAKVYRNVLESVQGGVPLSVAMSEQGKSFPELLCNIVESGEESGNIEEILLRMSTYYDKQLKMTRKVKSASAYPKLLAFISLIVVVALFGFVLPDLFVMFEGMEIPAITRFMMGFSNTITEFWPLIIFALVVIYLLFISLMRVKSVKRVVDKAKINLPVVGNLVRMIYSGRFSSTLAMLYASGLPLLETLRLSGKVIDNLYMRERLEEASDAVGAGTTLSEAVKAVDIFDIMLPNMIAIGEETGDLDGMLTTVSEYFEGESDTAIESMLSILGPALLIILAIVVAAILISVLIPVYNGYGTVALG